MSSIVPQSLKRGWPDCGHLGRKRAEKGGHSEYQENPVVFRARSLVRSPPPIPTARGSLTSPVTSFTYEAANNRTRWARVSRLRRNRRPQVSRPMLAHGDLRSIGWLLAEGLASLVQVEPRLKLGLLALGGPRQRLHLPFDRLGKVAALGIRCGQRVHIPGLLPLR